MKKLTKNKDGKYLLNHTSMNKVVDEVGKLEETSRISIELINKLFEGIQNGVYCINDDDDIVPETIDGFYRSNCEDEYEFDNSSGNYYLSDYGMSWALSKEELENE